MVELKFGEFYYKNIVNIKHHKSYQNDKLSYQIERVYYVRKFLKYI